MASMMGEDNITKEPRSHSSLGETDEEDGSVVSLRSPDDLYRMRSHDSVHTHELEGDSANGRRKRTAHRLLSQEETVQLVYQKVETTFQETKLSLVGSEAVSDVVKPKLAIDLGHSNIAWISEAVVDIIKDDVETYVVPPLTLLLVVELTDMPLKKPVIV